MLLIQDGHSSHVSIELIEKAHENNVCLLCLPAHTSHILQPLDVGVFKSFKSNFNKACGNYMKVNPGRVITNDVLASIVGQAYPVAFTPVNILSGFKKTEIYPFNPSSVDDRQLLPSNAVSSTPSTPASVEDNVTPNEVLFSPEKEKRFEQRYKEGYDIQDNEYIAWVKINHPEHCLSVGSSSCVKTSSSTSSGGQGTSDLSDVLVLPKPKEKSGRKRKAAVNQKAVCLTDDGVLSDLKTEAEKKENELEKIERKRICEEKKAEKERLKREKKKQKKQANKAGEGSEDLEKMLSGLALDETESDAECPKCGLLYSADLENLWVCCDRCSSWYDFKCTRFRSKRHLPVTYVCDSCK